MSIINTVQNLLGDFLGTNTQSPKAPEGFSINNFRSKIAETGVLKNNLFLTNFNLPSILANSYDSQRTRNLFYYASTAEIPSVALDVQEVRRYGYGPSEGFAVFPGFQPITITFIVDGRGENRKFFNNWVNSITNFHAPNGMTSSPGLTTLKPYQVSYKSEYVVDMSITVYDESADKILIYTFRDAFPVAVSGHGLTWDSQNQLMTVGVTFAYTDWSSNSIRATTINEANGIPGLSLFQKIVKLGTIAQTVSTFKTPRSVGDVINVVNNGSIIGDALNF